jgi:hypothetical protein
MEKGVLYVAFAEMLSARGKVNEFTRESVKMEPQRVILNNLRF